MTTNASEATDRLPALRSDLRIETVASKAGVFPAAIVSDDVRGSYFRLSWPESGIFLQWRQSGSVAEVCSEMHKSFGTPVSRELVAQVVEFAHANQLTLSDSKGSWHRYAALKAAGRRGWFETLMHGYLFFRIPLVRPEPWLERLLPWLTFVYSKWFWIGIAATAFAAMYLGARQWADVTAAAGAVLEMSSAGLYLGALLGLKAVHEVGHALTTYRYGCRVPSMGVAVMLGAPVFYTDTSDSWRLPDKSKRIAIVFAGVAAETIVAAAAALAWAFLADGPLRTICFAIATLSVATSLFINLNPFMRFDGYFALSDYLDVPNLQARSFALLTWKLREVLFDLGHDPPEQVPDRLRRTLIRYAAGTAIYRLVLYLGIAAVVYAVFGKAIGILLAAFEIAVFIVNPLVSELMSWWKLRGEILVRRRSFWTAGIAVAAIVTLFVPWLTTVGVPAVVIAEQETALYLPFPARLTDIYVKEGQYVRAGDPLFAADAAELDSRERKAWLRQRVLEFQVARLNTSEKERELRTVIERQLAQAREETAAIARQKQQLAVSAPFDGRIIDLDPQISNGTWLNEKQPLAVLIDGRSARARGLISETDIQRVAKGARAVFIPDDAAQPSQVLTVAELAPASDGRFTEPMLADRHGGSVVSGDVQGELVARHGMFDVTFSAFERPTAQVVRGVVRIEAAPTSPAQHLWWSIGRVLVREQGF